jgi:predicted DNA-binding transcriptional regulator AlpA
MFENDSDEYYSIKETVAMLGITTKTLSRHAKKLFPSTVESRGRRVRYSRADIDLIVESIENARTNAYHLDSSLNPLKRVKNPKSLKDVVPDDGAYVLIPSNGSKIQ